MASVPPLDAIVVGSGPNGLAAAVTLARAGLDVEVLEAEDTPGGGSRTLELGLAPGLVHDICSAVHPMAAASPFLRRFDLASRGVELRSPAASYAHPLEHGPAAIAWRDLDRTAEGLGSDGNAWRRLFAPLLPHVDPLMELVLSDKRSLPPGLLSPAGAATATRLGVRSLLQGTRAWSWPLRTPQARALLAGVSAHGIAALPSLSAGGIAIVLAALAHAEGWPIPVGGSGAITDALLRDLREHGGRIRLGTRVRTATDLPPARALLLDTSTPVAARILADRLSPPLVDRLRRVRRVGAAAKVDFVLRGPIPWRDPDVGRAGTVHLGGPREEMVRAERRMAAGRSSEHPLVLVSDPTVVDPAREVSGLRPVWAYAHVPFDDPRDPVETVSGQIERFAPGFRDQVVAARGIPAAQMDRHDENLHGGDIALGAMTVPRLLSGALGGADPYRLGDSNAWLCSSATPPAPGVHGMSGWWAARRVLRARFGITRMPDLGPEAG